MAGLLLGRVDGGCGCESILVAPLSLAGASAPAAGKGPLDGVPKKVDTRIRIFVLYARTRIVMRLRRNRNQALP
jgi:hypothetical protein